MVIVKIALRLPASPVSERLVRASPCQIPPSVLASAILLGIYAIMNHRCKNSLKVLEVYNYDDQ